jgi:hypothetical protein
VQIEALIEVSMYKRNQINEALVQVVRATHSRLDDDAILLRIKRLLDNDRKSKPSPGGMTPPVYAFFDDDAAGSGRDVTFSHYSVFALLIAFRLMSCGLTQGRAVFALRYFRASLEKEHQRISRIDIAPLLQAKGTVIAGANDVGRQQLIAKGNVVERSDDMVFFCIHADLEAVGLVTRTIVDNDGPRPDNICRGRKQHDQRLALDAYMNSPTLSIELMNLFIQISHLLASTEPTRRGRRRGA